MWSRVSSALLARDPHAGDREQPPLAGDALEMVGATVLEGEAGARDEILDRARDEHFSRLGVRSDPGAGVHGDAGDLPVDELAFAGVQARADLEPQVAHCPGDRPCAPDRTGRTVERREEAVPGGIELLAAGAGELAAH